MPTPVTSTEDQALVARFAATNATGPQIANEGDADTVNLPTARDLKVLDKLPGDWATAMALTIRAGEGLGSTDAGRGSALATSVSSELYQAWVQNLNRSAGRGTLTIRRIALAEVPEDRTAPLTFVGSATFTEPTTNSMTPFVVALTATRTNDGWRVTGARFDRYAGGR